MSKRYVLNVLALFRAEHAVYSSVEKYGQGQEHRMMGFHGLKVDDMKGPLLEQLVGKTVLKEMKDKVIAAKIKSSDSIKADWVAFEADFVILSEKYGIILFEVKGGDAVKKFKSKSHFPDKIHDAMKQLEIAEICLSTLLRDKSLKVHKVFVAPELSRTEVSNHYKNEIVIKHMQKGINFVYQEDFSVLNGRYDLSKWLDSYFGALTESHCDAETFTYCKRKKFVGFNNLMSNLNNRFITAKLFCLLFGRNLTQKLFNQLCNVQLFYFSNKISIVYSMLR